MRVPAGCVKIQLGLFYVVEVFADEGLRQHGGGPDAVGYALFDLHHRQLGTVFAFFGDVLRAAEALALV